MAEWETIRWFKPEEFDSPDRPGSGKVMMQFDLVRRLDAMRERLGRPLIVTSGYRTESYNETLDHSVSGSAHVGGWAADLSVRDSGLRHLILEAARDVGITRRGIASSFIHLDVDPTKPKKVAWVY